MKPLRLREQAKNDADAAAAWYAGEGGATLELAFIDALQAAYDLIQRHPAVGSLRHAELVTDLPTPLRFLTLQRFDRHLVYYIDLPGHIEVLRVWHASRGLDAVMEDID